MLQIRDFRIIKFFTFLFIASGFLIPFTVSCSAQPPEDLALKTLRDVTKDGNLPTESVVAALESRFAGTKTGALAKLLRARIKLESGDANGAATGPVAGLGEFSASVCTARIRQGSKRVSP